MPQYTRSVFQLLPLVKKVLALGGSLGWAHSQINCPKKVGKERKGEERRGKERRGKERKGRERRGKEGKDYNSPFIGPGT